MWLLHFSLLVRLGTSSQEELLTDFWACAYDNMDQTITESPPIKTREGCPWFSVLNWPKCNSVPQLLILFHR